MQNFGKIINAFNDVLVDAKIKDDKTKSDIFKKYLKMIHESKILKTEFLVYANLEDLVESEAKAFEIVKTNIGLLKSFNKKDITEANKKLVSLLGKYVKRLERPYDAERAKLHENIVKVVFTNENPKTAKMIVESLLDIVGYVNKNKKREPVAENLVPTDVLTKVAIRKFNEKYTNLTEDEKKLVKSMISSTDEYKKEIYTETVNKCVDLIDAKLTESDLDTKDKLLRAKDKLLRGKFISESFINDMSRIIELKESLLD